MVGDGVRSTLRMGAVPFSPGARDRVLGVEVAAAGAFQCLSSLAWVLASRPIVLFT